MPTWLVLVIQLIEQVLAWLTQHPPSVEHTADVDKLNKALELLKY